MDLSKLPKIKSVYIFPIFAGVVLLFGVGLAVVSVQQRQEISSRAATSAPTCSSQGGICQYSTCTTKPISGSCGSQYMTCCAPSCSTPYNGKCQSMNNACDGFYVAAASGARLCSGSDPTIQCCAPYSKAQPGDRAVGGCDPPYQIKGTCQGANISCSGSYVSGKCPGALKCCVPSGGGGGSSNPPPSSYGNCSAPYQNDTCQDTSTTCSGSYVPGHCPGGANIQCCVPSSSSTGGGGTGGGGTGGGGTGTGGTGGTGGSSNPPPAGSTTITLDLLLHGIGNAGDSVLPGTAGGGNMKPVNTTRKATVEVFDSKNKSKAKKTSTLTFDTTAGSFKGSVDLGKTFATGTYTVKVTIPGYLQTAISGTQKITTKQDNPLPQTSLVTGDINNDGKIDITDYNILIGCYSYFAPATSCNATQKIATDLDDDGSVNQSDLNLFLRELSQIK